MAARPLLLVTVGTDHHPFDRLVTWAEHVARSRTGLDVVVQHGHSRPPRGVTSAVPLLPYHELQDLLRGASVIACHGGPATIMEIRAAGRVPIAVPRRASLGEHVDDHQVRFVGRLHDIGHVHVADAQADFAQRVDQCLTAPPRTGMDPASTGIAPAVDTVARLLDDLERRPRRRRRLQRR